MAQPSQLTPEMLVPRLGDYLVQKGLIKEEELQRALAFQQEQIALGHTCLLGQALVDLKLLKPDSLDQAITEQIITGAWSAGFKNVPQNCRKR